MDVILPIWTFTTFNEKQITDWISSFENLQENVNFNEKCNNSVYYLEISESLFRKAAKFYTTFSVDHEADKLYLKLYRTSCRKMHILSSITKKLNNWTSTWKQVILRIFWVQKYKSHKLIKIKARFLILFVHSKICRTAPNFKSQLSKPPKWTKISYKLT